MLPPGRPGRQASMRTHSSPLKARSRMAGSRASDSATAIVRSALSGRGDVAWHGPWASPTATTVPAFGRRAAGRGSGGCPDRPACQRKEARASGLLESGRLRELLSDALRRDRARRELGETLKELHLRRRTTSGNGTTPREQRKGATTLGAVDRLAARVRLWGRGRRAVVALRLCAFGSLR